MTYYLFVHFPLTPLRFRSLGTVEPFSLDPKITNQLEKRYFTPGNLGFPAFRTPSLKSTVGGDESPIVGMLICNDRRWAEGWRVLGMQGVEIVCIGYVSLQLPFRNVSTSFDLRSLVLFATADLLLTRCISVSFS